ncbi:class I SAM-dependent methyltransferase [Streptomyces sp. NPDC049577]|uniref:class I SAM-dependent methyltransferase n=1 Tax=Streptomyces sp. NPDC049577 TaxID=3155153 RepID=UPI00342C5B99
MAREFGGNGAYDGPRAADGYAARDDRMDRLLGHPFVFRALALTEMRGRTLLDFGCGPGIVAERAARLYGVRVLAVDVSPAMLQAARRRNPPGAEFRLIRDGRVADLPDRCADAAMCNHVLATLPDKDGILRLLSEIHRLLKPGGRLAVLASDPTRAGTRFSCQQVGEPGMTYRPGDPFPAHLKCTDGSWHTFPDFYWPPEILPPLLSSAGFTCVSRHHPSVEEAAEIADPELLRSDPWTAERAAPPLVVTTATAA